MRQESNLYAEKLKICVQMIAGWNYGERVKIKISEGSTSRSTEIFPILSPRVCQRVSMGRIISLLLGEIFEVEVS